MARKQLITPVSFLVLFLVTNFSIAQDMGCGTCGNFGTYGLGNETAVINHVFTCPAGNCNDAAGDFNFIGGSNSQDFFNTQTAINSMAYGDGARVNANESFVFGSNVDNNSFAETFVFGEGI